MSRFDDSDSRIPTHRGPAVRRGASRRRRRVGAPYERPRLRLVYSRRTRSLPFGMHPALPSTLAFAALSMTALAVAAVVDIASGIGAAASSAGRQLRATLG